MHTHGDNQRCDQKLHFWARTDFESKKSFTVAVDILVHDVKKMLLAIASIDNIALFCPTLSLVTFVTPVVVITRSFSVVLIS